MTEQVGAVNKVDERFIATISNYRTSSDGVIPSRYVEFTLGNGETVEHGFHFNIMSSKGWSEIRPRDGNDMLWCNRFCHLIQIAYDDFKHGHVDGIIGKLIGVTAASIYRGREITGFYPIADLSTMPTPD